MTKPQLVTLDGGIHNRDLEKTNQRLIKGASWKKQRIVQVIPAGESIPTKVYLSHCGLITPPNQPFYRMAAMGMEVGEAFSNAVEQILSHPELSQYEWLGTLEHDNCPPQDGWIKLIEAMEEHPEYAAISGLYFLKGDGGCAQLWGDPKDPIENYRPQVPIPNTIQEVNAIGMGFALWRLSMFKDPKLRRPWFKTLNGKDGVGVGTQDIYFCSNAKKHGYRFAVHTGIGVGHFDHEGKFGLPDTMY